MSNSQDFIKTYNRIVAHLRKETGSESHEPFYRLIDKAKQRNAFVRRNELALKSFGDLRNAIIHYKDYPESIIADPKDHAVKDFESIVERIVAPEICIPKFQGEVKVFSLGESLIDTLLYMCDMEFSQVVVDSGKSYELMTYEGFATWFLHGSGLDTDLSDCTILDVYDFESFDTLEVVKRDSVVMDVVEIFESAVSRGIPKLYAVLITQNGRYPEKPLGIITPWDIIQIN